MQVRRARPDEIEAVLVVLADAAAWLRTGGVEQWPERFSTEWVMPGATMHSAALDMARTVCRRAEQRVCALQEANQLPNAEILVFLNRLSDLLWLFARFSESRGS